MKHVIQILIIIVFFAMSPSSYSQVEVNTKNITIPKILSPSLKLDGIANEEVWSKAINIENFEHNEKNKALNEKTLLHLFYDDEAFYVAFQCEDKDIQSTYKNHDADLWDEEVMEFFIYPHAEIPNPIKYFELQWNPLGTVFDGIITNYLNNNGKSESRKLDREWTAMGMNFAVRVNGSLNDSSDIDKEWSGEIKLPFQSLGQHVPKSGDTWRANFYRYNRNTGEEVVFVAWNPTQSTFHEPNWFGSLIFE